MERDWEVWISRRRKKKGSKGQSSSYNEKKEVHPGNCECQKFRGRSIAEERGKGIARGGYRSPPRIIGRGVCKSEWTYQGEKEKTRIVQEKGSEER